MTEEHLDIITQNKDSDNQTDDTSVHDLDKSDDLAKIQEAVDNIVQEREERNKIEKTNREEEDKQSEKTIEEEKKDEKEKKDNSNTLLKKNKIKCPICPKTFPREINLKNHMNIHSTRRSLRAKNVERTDTKFEPKNTNKESTTEKYYCSKCKLKFLSESQLKRHLTIHKETKKVPGFAPKKLQMLRKSVGTPLKLRKSINKAILPDRPKANLIKKSIDTKNVMMSPRRPFKCDQCPQSFSQRTLLASHNLIHKQYPCNKCNIRFTSKALLEDHLKKKCGRNEVQKSIVRSPLKAKSRVSQIDLRKSVVRSPMKAKNRISQAFHTCTSCRQRFRTLELLKEHDIKEHKKPVNKTINIKSVATRSKRPHGGVPTSSRMQKAFDLMKLKS